MWKTIINSDCLYLIKWVTSPNYALYLSDLKELWMERLEKDEISERFKVLNPLCQTSDVIGELTGLFNGLDSEHVTLKVLESTVTFSVKCTVDDFEIKFNWNMEKQPNDMEITLNLIKTVTTLEQWQEELYCMLDRKDKEKDEYIREYGEISRDFLKTVKFTRDKFVEDSGDAMLSILSKDAVVNSLNEKYGVKILKRKCNQTEDKTSAKKLRKYTPKFLRK